MREFVDEENPEPGETDEVLLGRDRGDSMMADLRSEFIDKMLKKRGGYIDPGEAGVSYFEHFLNRGHQGKVNCVSASETLDYMVTGGADYTMRIWAYDLTTDHMQSAVETCSYELCGVLMHDVEFEKDQGAIPEPPGFVETLKKTLCGGGEEAPAEVAMGVTAVACAGTKGPFISGTTHGTVYIVALDVGGDEGTKTEAWAKQVKRHTKKINCLSVNGGLDTKMQAVLDRKPLDGAPWSFMIGSEDCTATVVNVGAVTRSGVLDLSTLALREPMAKPVIKVSFLNGNCDLGELPDDALAYATSTEDAVYLWDKTGECKHTLVNTWNLKTPKLEEDGSTSYSWQEETPIDTSMAMMSVAHHANGSLIFAGNGDPPESGASVWNVEGGQLCDPHGMTAQENWDPLRPILTYKHVGDMLAVEHQKVSFAIDIRNDFMITKWNLEGVSPHMLAIEPRAAVNKLAAPGTFDQVSCTMMSRSIPTSMALVYDPDDAGGPALIVGDQDGIASYWDLDGPDTGEIVAEVRSLALYELILPVVLIVLTFFQVVSFAFGPAIEWRQEVHRPMNFTRKFVFMEMDVVIDLPREEIFWPEVVTAIVAMCLFLFCACTPIQELFDWGSRKVQSADGYRDKQALAHSLYVVLQTGLSYLAAAVNFYMMICATLAVVPCFKKCAEAMDCVHPEGGHWSWLTFVMQVFFGVEAEGKKPYLSIAPQITCFEGQHRVLYLVMMALVPAYLLVLIPYAVVEGDCSYVTTTKVWVGIYQSFKTFASILRHGKLPWDSAAEHFWVASARRQATVVDKGFLHPNPKAVFIQRTVELVSKAILPVIAIETTHLPEFQVFCILAVGVCMCIVSFVYPPMAHAKFGRVIQGARVFTVGAMSCGVLTVFMKKGSAIPMIVLAVLALVVPSITAVLVCKEEISRGEVQQICTSAIEEDATEQVDTEDNNAKSCRRAHAGIRGFFRKFKPGRSSKTGR